MNRIEITPRGGSQSEVGASAGSKWRRIVLGKTIVQLLIAVGAVGSGCSPHRSPPPVAPVAEKNDGLPGTLAELNAWYTEPPAGQNAAAAYLRGFDALQITNAAALPCLGKAPMPALGTPWPVPMKSALAALVKLNEPTWHLLAEGAQNDHCRYPIDFTPGYEATFPHLKQVDLACSFLELAAIHHAEVNQADRAVQDVLLGLALANSLADEPTVLSQLSRTWGVSHALAAFEQIVNRRVLTAEACAKFAGLFQKLEEREARGEGFGRAMFGERAMALTALADPPQLLRALATPDLNIPADRRAQVTARLQSGAPLTAEREFYENSFHRMMTARQSPFPARLQVDELGRQLVVEALARKLFVLELVLPDLGRRTSAEGQCLARLRLGLTAVALEQFRAAHGNHYPAALSELTPGVLPATPADPFDGQPLRYERKVGGYVLYSIGPDLADNSGQPMNGKEGDVTFVVAGSISSAH